MTSKISKNAAEQKKKFISSWDEHIQALVRLKFTTKSEVRQAAIQGSINVLLDVVQKNADEMVRSGSWEV